MIKDWKEIKHLFKSNVPSPLIQLITLIKLQAHFERLDTPKAQGKKFTWYRKG